MTTQAHYYVQPSETSCGDNDDCWEVVKVIADAEATSEQSDDSFHDVLAVAATESLANAIMGMLCPVPCEEVS